MEAAAAAPSPGIQKSLDRINAQVAAGAAYEAQQMYKTVYHRCKARRAAADGYAVLRGGAVTQLQAGQVTCGMELAGLLVAAYAADGVRAEGAALQSLLDVLAALPAPLPAADGDDGAAALGEAARFAGAALKWAHKAGGDAGVPRMHDAFAGWVWAAFGWRALAKAALHWSRGADAGAYAGALRAAAAEAGGGEWPLFVTRAVLQTLACAHAATVARQLAHAGDVLAACTARDPGLAAQPLAHFCELLLQALALRKQPLVSLLTSRYSAALGADPSFEAYLASIEALWFDVRPPGGGGGLLGGLLRAMLEGDELADDE
ncbi:GET4 [Scenedesmus sp. PABB004]|nr:GET4 [Scenedesmus sp. PABB004]